MKIAIYDGKSCSFHETGSAHGLRWASWRGDGRMALLVGNHGTVLTFDGKRFKKLRSEVKENLRCVSFSPKSDEALIVGNGGLLMAFDGEKMIRIPTGTDGNLRRVAWKPDGRYAMAVGNDGMALLYSDGVVKPIPGSSTNLRAISWSPKGKFALISGNSFSRGFVPSPIAYAYEPKSRALEPVLEGSSDLVGLDFKPDGSYALAVGYHVTWHEPSAYRFVGKKAEELKLDLPYTYPVAVMWNPKGHYALIGTANPEAGGTGKLLRYDEKGFTELQHFPQFHIGCISWNPSGDCALILGSPWTRTFTA